MNNRTYIAAHRARQTALQMKKSTRIKNAPLASRADFDTTVAAVLELETQLRKINAERDAELLAINSRFDKRAAPLEAEIKGRMALAEDYAAAHAQELLPEKTARSFRTSSVRIGWRTGNRKVGLLHRVTEANAINALKALGLGSYVRSYEALAKDAILSDCADDKTLLRTVRDPGGEVVLIDGQPQVEPVPLAEAGLKITRGDTFFVEPDSEHAATITPATTAAA